MSQPKRLDISLRQEKSRLTQRSMSASSSAPSTTMSPTLILRSHTINSLSHYTSTAQHPPNSRVDEQRHHKASLALSTDLTFPSILSSPVEFLSSPVTVTDVDRSGTIFLEQTANEVDPNNKVESGGRKLSVKSNSASVLSQQSEQEAGPKTSPDLNDSQTLRERLSDKKLDSSASSSSVKANGAPPQATMPRTSSIDSAISSISSSSHPQKTSLDIKDPSPAEIRTLIETAGSVEYLIQHLLKEKHHTDSQNAQLWKLVDKQRALLLGLNKDLERLNKEKERYKKKAKELQGHNQPLASNMVRKDSQSPLRNGGVEPIVSKRLGREKEIISQFPSFNTPKSKHQPRFESSPVDPAMMPPPLHLQQPLSIESVVQPVRKSSESIEDREFVRSPIDEKEDDIFGGPAIKTEEELRAPTIEIMQAPATAGTNPQRQMPKLPPMQTSLGPPSFALVEPSPLNEKSAKSFSAARKAPAPLNLKQSAGATMLTQSIRPQDVSESAVSESVQSEDSPVPARGRKKTREEDDKERELAAIEEQEARSRSKKEKGSKSPPEDVTTNKNLPLLAFPPVIGLPLSPRYPPPSFQDRLAPPTNFTSSLQPNSQTNGTITEQLLTAPLRSPGLPTSPRPGDRPMGSPLPRNPRDNPNLAAGFPMSPKFGSAAPPLTPRAPKYPIPLPPNNRIVGGHALLTTNESRTTSPTEPPPVYQGLMSPAYPDLLLPPNALPSIEVKVASSRMRPSANATNVSKNQEDCAVFSLSIFSRSSGEELWRIEKSALSLPQLDQALRYLCSNLPKVPEKRLFNGHAPAVMDARRNSLDMYFDELLDTPMDENSGKIICRFLSTDTIDLRAESPSQAAAANNTRQLNAGLGEGKSRKVGYLTKRGKNFGGWKSRYFILESPELRYYESPGGAHLGTIKLLNAQIGKQSQAESPVSQSEDTDENQYRHAFLILEPKRKDSNSHVKHVLCAENDGERDEWVEALLHYVTASSVNNSNHSVPASNGDKPEIHSEGQLKAVNYADTYAGTQPSSVSSISKTKGDTSSPILGHEQGVKSLNISGPLNGAVISDAGLWGNKPASQPKDQKKRNIFHFKQRPSTDSTIQNSGHDDPLRSNGSDARHNDVRVAIRHVFGLPLAEAVEYCSPVGVNVNLPAVVYRCIEYLRAKDAASEEGIFRLSGSNLVVRNLKERFNTEGDVDFLADDQYYDVHAIASLFKTYLRELPSTVLTRELHLDFIAVLDVEDNAQKIAALNRLVHQLPSVNFSLLRTLSQYLLEVVQNSDKNKMGVRNVGLIFPPTLNIPAPVFSLFLTEFDTIFGDLPTEQTQTREVEITVTNSLSPEDVRSPRRQMFTDLPTPAYNQTSFTNGSSNGFPSTPHGPQSSPRTNGAAGIGFTPLQPSYGNYLSIPPTSSSIQPRQQYSQQSSMGDGAYGSLNHMMSPENAPNAKAKRRESSMIFM